MPPLATHRLPVSTLYPFLPVGKTMRLVLREMALMARWETADTEIARPPPPLADCTPPPLPLMARWETGAMAELMEVLITTTLNPKP